MAYAKLGRTSSHRRATLRAITTALLEKGKIQTTETKAKAVSSLAEKMITLGKLDTLAARRQAMTYLTSEDVMKKLFDTIAPRYKGVNGGYTRIYKLEPRRGDAAPMAQIELV